MQYFNRRPTPGLPPSMESTQAFKNIKRTNDPEMEREKEKATRVSLLDGSSAKTVAVGRNVII